jgi:hypothetical protein
MQVPIDEGGYPIWQWPDTASRLLFDIGFSYGILHETRIMLRSLYLALNEMDASAPEYKILAARLKELLDKMDNFRGKRLNIRDEIYAAGYLAAAKLDAENSL